jgi:hypothetical protein
MELPVESYFLRMETGEHEGTKWSGVERSSDARDYLTQQISNSTRLTFPG